MDDTAAGGGNVSDWYWVVPTDSWPTFDIDREKFMEMLEQFDEYYGPAVASLANAGLDDPV